jgi:hypothetical protein
MRDLRAALVRQFGVGPVGAELRKPAGTNRPLLRQKKIDLYEAQ